MLSRRCSSVFLLVLLAAAPVLAAGVPRIVVRGQAEALEGDLLLIDRRKVRLMGIDAPDPGQICQNRYGSPFDCGSIATGVLRALVAGRAVDCTVTERDRTGMEMGECRAGGVDLGAAMVARGWAFAYRSLSGAYQNNEAYAQSRRIGLWSGKVEKPWQWRTRQLRSQSR
jgi:endonuclease YncB( thermonuclease family)